MVTYRLVSLWEIVFNLLWTKSDFLIISNQQNQAKISLKTAKKLGENVIKRP